eukprot:CAMPEP_0205800384 /NCGR_PEP_ID=MMETSP0205-20121125/2032_1 /ASSEMBLY_ACC=CAM_ASM_000278 /TAXON_ID=36767 /ORGANISM="Euplotes focardii, Strain TN1" /LENGTH=207 /DNA_ID=CAMNT_0053063397 /DNA_START=69 /DNA_END=692 /DNA_ORIENTATION=+
MSLVKEDGAHPQNIKNVFETNIGGLDLVVDQLISVEHNKVKAQYTTFSGEVPAFDIMIDYTEGKILHFFNLTGECKVYEIPKMDLGEYFKDVFKNHVEFAGFRGEHLEIYEMKHPEEEGSRTWIYGAHVDHHGHQIFVPTRFQSHHPSQKESPDFAGDFIDTPSIPEVSEATFAYPQCAEANVAKLDMPITTNIFGINTDALLASLR